jgi:glycosyltransferase involved in cell wall biosynthesis
VTRNRSDNPVKKLLLVAYHFPPQAGSSGLLRSLKFCRYFPERSWLPVVLTAHPRAYEHIDSSQLEEVPPEVKVIRAFALDTKRHLSIFGHYPLLLALPDPWVSWVLGGIAAGLVAIQREKIDLIFATFPIATAVLIGYFLHRLTGIPLVLDFRDSMTEDEYPPDKTIRRVYRWIERKVISRGGLFVFTAPSTIDMYLSRYPQLARERCLLIPNGYDEPDFQSLTVGTLDHAHAPLRLLHSGLIYPIERDPRALFRALARLKRESRVAAAELRVDLRASGAEEEYSAILRELDIADIVHLLPRLPYRQGLQDAAEASGLLLLQGPSCNHQIPAKLYEYARLRKPILALTPTQSDTAAMLRRIGGSTIVDLSDDQMIYEALPAFLDQVRKSRHSLPDRVVTMQFDRRNQAHELAGRLSELVEEFAGDTQIPFHTHKKGIS